MNESDKDRRRAPRHKVNLHASVLISAIDSFADNKEPFYALQGRLRDVSLSGLAVIISSEDMEELKALGESITLHLLLPLPTQAIEVNAIPVRYQPLQDDEGSDVLVGAHITNMNGRDRILFMEFIHGFEA